MARSGGVQSVPPSFSANEQAKSVPLAEGGTEHAIRTLSANVKDQSVPLVELETIRTLIAIAYLEFL